MKLTVEELRGLFLFEKLDDEKLAWLAEHGTVETAAAGATVYSEATSPPASTCSWRARSR